MKKLIVSLLSSTMLLLCVMLPAQKNLIPQLQRVKRTLAADFEGRGFNLTKAGAGADEIYCGIINPVLGKNQPLPLKEFSIWKYVEEPDFVSMQKIHSYQYPGSENFLPLHFNKDNSETTLYALQDNKLFWIDFTGKLVRKSELAALDNGIKVIKAEVSKDKILLAYIAEDSSRNWILAEYDLQNRAFSQKTLPSVPCAASDTTAPVITKDGISFVTTDLEKKTSVITKTDRQGNIIAVSQELPLTLPMLVLGVDDLITCAGQYSRYDSFYVYVLNSELKVMLNFDLIDPRHNDEEISTTYVNQLTHTKEAFLLQTTAFKKDGDYMTYIYKRSMGSGGGGGSLYKCWGIGFQQISEHNIVALGLSLHAFGVVRPNCAINYLN